MKNIGFSYKAFLWLIFVTVSIALLVFLTSCEKPEYCWECQQLKLDKLGTCSPELEIKPPFEICHKTEQEIRDFEQQYTYIICDNSSILKCKEK